MITLTHHHRYLSTVPRWSVVPVSRFQNVAEHSYFVSLYMVELLKLPCFDGWDPDRKFAALRYALVHDIAEARMGDTPGPVKRLIKDPAKFEKTEKSVVQGMGVTDRHGYTLYCDDVIRALVKVADLIDEYMHLTMEHVGGNGHVASLRAMVDNRLRAAVHGCCVLRDHTQDVISWVYGMESEISTGVLTLENNDDIDNARSLIAQCDCTFGCEKCDIPF